MNAGSSHNICKFSEIPGNFRLPSCGSQDPVGCPCCNLLSWAQMSAPFNFKVIAAESWIERRQELGNPNSHPNQRTCPCIVYSRTACQHRPQCAPLSGGRPMVIDKEIISIYPSLYSSSLLPQNIHSWTPSHLRE